MVREAWEGEAPEPCDHCFVLDVDGQIQGHVCVSDKFGLGFIHGLAHWGRDASGLTRLLIRAVGKVKDLGYQKLHASVEFDGQGKPGPMLSVAVKYGMYPVQLILEGEI